MQQITSRDKSHQSWRRRDFLGAAAATLPFIAWLQSCRAGSGGSGNRPIVISTWKHNGPASEAAWKVLAANGSALDAVHQGVMVPEADPKDQSVGYGGLPDRDGFVTVDACIMDHQGNCGSVMGVENVLHPITLARMVMEKTPHVQLVGAGAMQFAREMGVDSVNLLTPESELAWKEWLEEKKYNPMTTVENLLETIKEQHDTIGMVALDNSGHLSGACTTSGMAFKMRGRVGDSPIIGSGLYVDDEVGAASGTGVGEEIVRICGSHTVVEMMRQGASPTDACREAVRRLVKLRGEDRVRELQIGLIALNKKGEYGCFALNKEFTMCVRTADGAQVIESPSWFS